jgi:acyl carrier protein
MNDEVLRCVYVAIDEANQDRREFAPLEKSPDADIHGTATGLDSLGLINFLVATEEALEQEFGVPVVLSDDRALSQEPSPFRTVSSVVEYAEALLREQRAASGGAGV